VHRLQFHYTFVPQAQQQPGLIRNPLLDLLHAVQENGSISGAARVLGLSYRHVWGELKRWENELGNELLIWEKGQAARLSEFGTKLLWAERQAQARLSPQIEALRADLERAYAVAFDETVHVLTLYASHDDALSALRTHAAAAQQLQGSSLQPDVEAADGLALLAHPKLQAAGQQLHHRSAWFVVAAGH